MQVVLKTKLENIVKQLKEFQIKEKSIQKEQILLSDRDYVYELKEIEKELLELKNKEDKYKYNQEQIKKYLEYKDKLDEYNKWFSKLEECKNEEFKSRKILSVTETFMKKIQEAESIAVSQTIDTINYYMNFYLEKFFPIDPIMVEICPYKETKKDIKPMINIEVGYKGY